MIVKPTVSELLEKVDDRYELVIITSKRARQLTEGAEPLADKNEQCPVTEAAEEIAEGLVRKVEKNENMEVSVDETDDEKVEKETEKSEENEGNQEDGKED